MIVLDEVVGLGVKIGDLFVEPRELFALGRAALLAKRGGLLRTFLKLAVEGVEGGAGGECFGGAGPRRRAVRGFLAAAEAGSPAWVARWPGGGLGRLSGRFKRDERPGKPKQYEAIRSLTYPKTP